jgi:hypothetical protein
MQHIIIFSCIKQNQEKLDRSQMVFSYVLRLKVARVSVTWPFPNDMAHCGFTPSLVVSWVCIVFFFEADPVESFVCKTMECLEEMMHMLRQIRHYLNVCMKWFSTPWVVFAMASRWYGE